MRHGAAGGCDGAAVDVYIVTGVDAVATVNSICAFDSAAGDVQRAIAGYGESAVPDAYTRTAASSGAGNPDDFVIAD